MLRTQLLITNAFVVRCTWDGKHQMGPDIVVYRVGVENCVRRLGAVVVEGSVPNNIVFVPFITGCLSAILCLRSVCANG